MNMTDFDEQVMAEHLLHSASVATNEWDDSIVHMAMPNTVRGTISS